MSRLVIVIFLSLFFSNCTFFKKEDNLGLFLKRKEVLYEQTKEEDNPSLINKTIQLKNVKRDFTVSFWMNSNNFSKNGVLVSLLKEKNNQLKQSLITFFLSKKRIAILTKSNDYRKKENKFKNDFSENFLNLPILNLNEKYFVTLVFSSESNLAKIYVDGNLYTVQRVNLGDLPEKLYLQIGSTQDNNMIKYVFKGEISHFIVFEEKLDIEEVNLLMNLTLAENYPLKK